MEPNYKDKIILAIGAHPDDIDFGCGGTMAKLSNEGATVYCAVCTDGNRGSRQHVVQKAELIKNRMDEQLKAANLIGAKEVFFLEEEDGNLQSDILFKEKVVRLIRKIKPDMIFTHDPSWYYSIRDDRAFVNHTDHRACGEAVIDAVYPLARDLQSFPHHAKEGLAPHIVSELYLFNFDTPNFVFDITNVMDTKIKAVLTHVSQMDDPKAMDKWIRERAKSLGEPKNMTYGEGFTRLAFV